MVSASIANSQVDRFSATMSSLTVACAATMVQHPSSVNVVAMMCSRHRCVLPGRTMLRKIFCTGKARTMQWQRISQLSHFVHCKRWMTGKIPRSSSFFSSARTPSDLCCRSMLAILSVTLSSCLSQLLVWEVSSYGRTNSRTPGSCLAVSQRTSCATLWVCIIALTSAHCLSSLSSPHFSIGLSSSLAPKTSSSPSSAPAPPGGTASSWRASTWSAGSPSTSMSVESSLRTSS
mmetsp:Transcript_56582/g.101663  ORF Transcript_56582/g.101663 Transcript_56582/m.101663 type:complete len:233 (+) Transcript_56582:706-1404(+)